MQNINEKLIEASKAGDVQGVIFALGEGADVNYSDEDGHTALMYAAYQGHDEIIVILIASKADLNKISNSDYTALDYACKNGNISSAKF